MRQVSGNLVYTNKFNQTPIEKKSIIKVEKGDVNLSFFNAKTQGKSYKLEFIVNLIGPKFVNYSLRDLDIDSLKKSIISNIPKEDIPYLKIFKFDDRKVIFIFEDEKWFKEAVSNLKKSFTPGAFNSKFKFNRRIPRVISYDIIRSGFSEFIQNKFSEYMNKNKIAQRNHLFTLLPKDVAAKYSSRLNSLFTYSYNYSENAIVAEMKSEFVMMFVLAASNISNSRKTGMSGINFGQRVRGNMLKPISSSFANRGILGR